MPIHNPVQALFSAKKRQLKMSSRELGELVGMEGPSVRRKMIRGVWSTKDLQVWCLALDVSAEEIGRALLQ